MRDAYYLPDSPRFLSTRNDRSLGSSANLNKELAVREFFVPPVVSVPDAVGLPHLLSEKVAQSPQLPLFQRPINEQWRDVSASDFLDEVVAVAKGLIAAEVAPGDRVALMARTSYEWSLMDFAILWAGAVTVPIYETSSAEQVQWILQDSGAVAIITETDTHSAVVTSTDCGAKLTSWQLQAPDGRDAVTVLTHDGARVPASEVDRRYRSIMPEDLATIVYTSGTTGRPKGCLISHRNLYSTAANAVDSMPEVFRGEDSSTLLFLPLAHIFARVIQFGCVYAGARLSLSHDIKRLRDDFAVIHPTFVLAVPRVFEKIYNNSQQLAEAAGKGRIFTAAAATAIAYSTAMDHGGPGWALRVRHAVFDRLVYAKIRAIFGGRFRYALSGSAPLGSRLGHFFRGTGIIILEGYGLTEAMGGDLCNPPGNQKIGTVGIPIPGTTVRITDDGEILLKGDSVFRGYHQNPAATAEAITPDGWLRTGDLGVLDDSGHLSITGRKKEIIVTSTGKNVAPALLEDRIRAHPLVSQCIVVGESRPFICCLVTIDREAMAVWAQANGKSADISEAGASDDPDLLAAIQTSVDQANAAVSKAEAIRRFRVLPTDFTEDSGHLTPTLKLKRDVVTRDFAADIDALYR
jgi:long-chain acyl-CoA synthetase